MANLSTKITNIVSQDTLERISAEYKKHQIKTRGRKPHLQKLFAKFKVKQPDLELLYGVMGGSAAVHELLQRDIQVAVDDVSLTLESLLGEIRSRIPQMSDKDLVESAKVLMQVDRPQPAVTISNNFDINKKIAQRLIEVED